MKISLNTHFPIENLENFNSFSVTGIILVTSRQAILCYVTHDCNQFKASTSYAAENFQ